MNKLILFICVCLSLSFMCKKDHYVFDFDTHKGVLLETKANLLMIEDIKKKYSKCDSIAVSVSYNYPSIIFQSQSTDCAESLVVMLSDVMRSKVRLSDRGENYFRGTFYEKKRKKKISHKKKSVKIIALGCSR